ncbi:MAG: GspH/FimT family pseudopilin [Pseudomonadota bacterium]
MFDSTFYLPPRTDQKNNFRIKGFTSIELMTVLLIVIILSALAVPSFSNLIARQRTKNLATDFYFALAKTRSEALKRNTNVTLAPISSSWQNGWQILDASSNILDTHGSIAGITISGGPSTVVYQNSGRIVGSTAPSFLATSTADASIQSCVSTTLSGRPYMKASSC